jgi:hypothetical protein
MAVRLAKDGHALSVPPQLMAWIEGDRLTCDAIVSDGSRTLARRREFRSRCRGANKIPGVTKADRMAGMRNRTAKHVDVRLYLATCECLADDGERRVIAGHPKIPTTGAKLSAHRAGA